MLSLILNLTLEEIITDIPHDGAAFVVYLMLALFIGFIWYGSRPGASRRGGSTEGTSDVQ